MIIKKCDICNKKSLELNSIVLYTKSIDYCNKCELKAKSLMNKFKREVRYQNILYDSALKKTEKEYLRDLKKR